MLEYREANCGEMIEEGESICHIQVARGDDNSNELYF